MAASNNGGVKNMFSIVGGKFSKRVEEDTEGAVSRVLEKGKNAGKEVWELQYNTLAGTIDKIEIVETDWAQNINVTLDDGDVLSMQLDSSVGSKFIKMLPNIEADLPVTMTTWMGDDGKLAFAIQQKGQYVKWAFTRENPNGMPQAEKEMVAGKEKWNYSKVQNFLYNALVKEIERFGGKYDKDVPEKLQGVMPKQEENDDIPTIQVDEEDDVKIKDVPFG